MAKRGEEGIAYPGNGKVCRHRGVNATTRGRDVQAVASPPSNECYRDHTIGQSRLALSRKAFGVYVSNLCEVDAEETQKRDGREVSHAAWHGSRKTNQDITRTLLPLSPSLSKQSPSISFKIARRSERTSERQNPPYVHACYRKRINARIYRPTAHHSPAHPPTPTAC